jgi:hypothetical protein
MQQPENSIPSEEQYGHKHRTFMVSVYDRRITGLDQIAFELLLYASAFKRIRKETECHLDSESNKDNYNCSIADS